MRSIICLILLFAASSTAATAQESTVDQFWNNLSALCGKAFIGEVIEAPEDDNFRTQELVMHVRSCKKDEIKIPFFVGENRSRTWIFTRVDDRIRLKHDHRKENGSDDELTMYGGTTTNTGSSTIQSFPADDETVNQIPEAATNVWWFEVIPGEHYTYNLRRLGTDRFFSIRFDVNNETEIPEAPWGWDD